MEKCSLPWEQTPLVRALQSLDLHRRLVSLGLDGSLSVPCARPQTPFFYRAVLWRVYLGVLPLPFTATAIDRLTEGWGPALFAQRAHYAGSKQRLHQCYPAFAKIDAPPPPGSAGSPARCDWRASVQLPPTPECHSRRGDKARQRHSVDASRRHVAGEHEERGRSVLEAIGDAAVSSDIIALDIRRSFPPGDPEAPHAGIFHVLSLWRWLHPSIGYHQGMHELAGQCFAVLHRAALGAAGIDFGGANSVAAAVVAECANPHYIEADAYALFDCIMRRLGLATLYRGNSAAHLRPLRLSASLGPSSPASSQVSAPAVPGSTDVESDDADDVECGHDRAKAGDLEFASSGSSLEALCEHIVGHLVRDSSRVLHRHLAAAGILDQRLAFLPRWLQSLFLRELSPAQSFVVWDAVFAVFHHESVAAAQEGGRRTTSKLSVSERQLATTPSSNTSIVRQLLSRMGSAFASDDTTPGVPGLQSAPSVSAPMFVALDSDSGATDRLSCSRLIAGLAAAALLYLEDDLLAHDDDFAMLRRLSQSPLLPSTADVFALVFHALQMTRTLPEGVLLASDPGRHANVQLPHQADASQARRRSSRAAVHAAVSASCRTREQLLAQQHAVGLVVSSVARRVAVAAHIDELDRSSLSSTWQPTSKPNGGSVTPSADEVATIAAALSELQFVADRLEMM